MSPFRTRLFQLLAPSPSEPERYIPARDDDFATWLKARRDDLLDGYGADCPPPAWHTVDALLDLYRLHADTATPLGQHVCEAGNRDDCGHESHPF